VSLTVIESIAEAEDVDPHELEVPLADAIDPCALDRLFSNTTAQLSFKYPGYVVTVDCDGVVDVAPTDED
jgi:hypothetical protein